MAEMDEVTSSTDEVVEETQDTEEVDTYSEEYSPKDEYTYEEVLAMEARLKKAEAALVEKKRAEKEAKKNKAVETVSSEYITKQDLALEKFIDKNPEMEEYRDDIKKHLSKGLSLSEAKLLVDNGPALVNREKIKKSSISFSEGWASKTTYTRADLENMSQKEYALIRRQAEDGKVIIRG